MLPSHQKARAAPAPHLPHPNVPPCTSQPLGNLVVGGGGSCAADALFLEREVVEALNGAVRAQGARKASAKSLAATTDAFLCPPELGATHPGNISLTLSTAACHCCMHAKEAQLHTAETIVSPGRCQLDIRCH
jgi:hypothetical protein